jgi:hypothetical protein
MFTLFDKKYDLSCWVQLVYLCLCSLQLEHVIVPILEVLLGFGASNFPFSLLLLSSFVDLEERRYNV